MHSSVRPGIHKSVRTFARLKTRAPIATFDAPRAGAQLPALDGLRGIVVVLVMLHHFARYGPKPATFLIDKLSKDLALSNWSGVDLFFVLSGFLITGILLDAKGKERYFRVFYSRLVLRIFPLYYGFFYFLFAVPSDRRCN